MGGLGNQIFQIFATISYAIKSRNQFKFLNIKTLGAGSTTLRNTFWDSFFSRLKPFLINAIPEPIHLIREKDFTYNELPLYEMVGHDTLIYGYFQSYKYFQENFETICKIINVKNMKDKLLVKLEHLYDSNLNLKECFSIHLRIVDYKKIQDFHPIRTKEYYLKSLNVIKRKYNNNFTVIYFCEENDLNDVMMTINYLKNQFKEFTFIRGDNSLEDWEQLLFMSCCHHNIIANSSFSWWAAYFNEWTDKIVCYPSIWFGPASKHNTKDLCPNEWIQIQLHDF
jgi:hypothetical protein